MGSPNSRRGLQAPFSSPLEKVLTPFSILEQGPARSLEGVAASQSFQPPWACSMFSLGSAGAGSLAWGSKYRVYKEFFGFV